MSIPQSPMANVSATRAGEYLIECIYALILVITVLGWTIVGFGVWVPLLVRTTTLFAGTVFYASLFRDQARLDNAQRGLHFSVRFYLRGFEHFLNFYRQRRQPEQPVGLLEPLTEMKWKELLVDCLWVIIVWTVGYVLMHRVLASLF